MRQRILEHHFSTEDCDIPHGAEQMHEVMLVKLAIVIVVGQKRFVLSIMLIIVIVSDQEMSESSFIPRVVIVGVQRRFIA